MRVSRLRRSFVTTIGLTIAVACGNDGATPPTDPDPSATGPSPVVEMGVAFGNPPLADVLHLVPAEGSENWRYELDLDEDGQFEHRGVLETRIGFPYRFSAPGVHRLRIVLNGPEGPLTVEKLVVVNDPDAFRVTTVFKLPGINHSFSGFQALAISERDNLLFAANRQKREGEHGFTGELFSIDTQSLVVRESILVDVVPFSLALSPSEQTLFILHASQRISVVDVPTLGVQKRFGFEMGHRFIHALDESRVVTSGEFPGLSLIDTDSEEQQLPVLFLASEQSRHFAVSRSGDKIALVTSRELPLTEILVIDSTDFTIRESHSVEAIDGQGVVALGFDSTGSLLYVLGRDPVERRLRLILLDVESGELHENTLLENITCINACDGGRFSAISGTGRYVAFALEDAIIIDTELDVPVYSASDFGVAVVASAADDVFSFLSLDGTVRRVEPAN